MITYMSFPYVSVQKTALAFTYGTSGALNKLFKLVKCTVPASGAHSIRIFNNATYVSFPTNKLHPDAALYSSLLQ